MRTDLWRVDRPAGPGDGHTAWWRIKEAALHVLPAERHTVGCDCDAPPWFSEPGSWPLQILLVHNPGCAADTGIGQVTHDVTPSLLSGVAQLDRAPGS